MLSNFALPGAGALGGFRPFAEDANFLELIRESGRQSCPVATGSFPRLQCGRVGGFNAFGDHDLLAELPGCGYCTASAALLNSL